MVRNKSLVAVCCVLSALAVSCAGTAHIETIEEKLGKGWVCYAAPDAFKKAGVVVEVTADGKYVFDSDFSGRAVEGESSIGTASVSSTSTLGGVLKVLQNLGAITKASSITADLTRTVTIEVTYGGTRKYVLRGTDVRDIADVYATRRLTPTSRYLVFRESQSATSVDILVKKSVVASLNATAILDDIVNVNPKITRNGADQYHLKDHYDQPIGVCTIATELVIEHGFDGKTAVRPGDPFRVSDNVTIERRIP